MKSQLYLVDASIYIFRAYFSLPERWHSPDGYPLNAVYGYSSFLVELMQALQSNADTLYFTASFDESLGSGFRHQVYPGYKASRELPDEALAFQLAACRQVTELLGIACFGGKAFEADDYIASLARLGREQGAEVTIVSRDKDLGQLLLREQDTLWDYAADSKMSRHGFQEKFGVLPEQFPDYQGLVGDSVDDIPGVPAVGAKTGAALIAHFGDLETLEPARGNLQELGLRGAARISENLNQYWDQALLSRRLAKLDDSIAGVRLPAAFEIVPDKMQKALDYLTDIGLSGAVLQRLQRLMRESS